MNSGWHDFRIDCGINKNQSHTLKKFTLIMFTQEQFLFNFLRVGERQVSPSYELHKSFPSKLYYSVSLPFFLSSVILIDCNCKLIKWLGKRWCIIIITCIRLIKFQVHCALKRSKNLKRTEIAFINLEK